MASWARAVARRLRLRRALRGLRLAASLPGRGVRAVRSPALRAAGELRAAPARARLFADYRRTLARRIGFTVEAGSVDVDGLAVVMCLWNRPGRLVSILDVVAAQQTARPLHLVLWNNQPAHAAEYRRVIAEHGASGALASIRLFDSPANIGGIGRFLAIRELVRQGYRGAYVMLDDDQDVGPGFVDDLLSLASPDAIAGVWAWTNEGAYWNRSFVELHGAPADHVGTGGSVCDSAIVDDPRFFTGIPTRFLFMEDIWMSHYATRNGWSLRKAASPVEFVLGELDQGHAIFDSKELFYRWLAVPGRIPARAGR